MTELEKREREIAYLWGLLDDISTAGDMYKPEINGYFKYVNRVCEMRGKIAHSDGHDIFLEDNGKQVTKP